jgi:hypothetical protein
MARRSIGSDLSASDFRISACAPADVLPSQRRSKWHRGSEICHHCSRRCSLSRGSPQPRGLAWSRPSASAQLSTTWTADRAETRRARFSLRTALPQTTMSEWTSAYGTRRTAARHGIRFPTACRKPLSSTFRFTPPAVSCEPRHMVEVRTSTGSSLDSADPPAAVDARWPIR